MDEKAGIIHITSEYNGLAPDSTYSLRGGLGVMVGDLAREQSENRPVRVFVPGYIHEGPLASDGAVDIEKITHQNTRFEKGEMGERMLDFPESYSEIMSESYSPEYVHHIRTFQRFSESALLRIKGFVNSEKTRVVHMHDWHFGLLAEKLQRERSEGRLPPDLAIISTIHNARYEGKFPLTLENMNELSLNDETPFSTMENYIRMDGKNAFFSMLRMLHTFSDATTTVSSTYNHLFQDSFPGLIDHNFEMDVVTNGLHFPDIKEYEDDIRDRMEYEKPRLLIANRAAPEKGLDSILGSIDELTKKFHVSVAGLDSQEKFRGKKVTSLGMIEREELHKCMKRSAVYLSPSTDLEPFGLAPLEALAYGAIPVVSAVGGHLDNFTDIREDPDEGNAIVIGEINHSTIGTDIDFSKEILTECEVAYSLCVDDIGQFARQRLLENGNRQFREGQWSISDAASEYDCVYQKVWEKLGKKD